MPNRFFKERWITPVLEAGERLLERAGQLSVGAIEPFVRVTHQGLNALKPHVPVKLRRAWYESTVLPDIARPSATVQSLETDVPELAERAMLIGTLAADNQGLLDLSAEDATHI